MRLSSMISAVDLHACGEPGRVIVGGVRDVPGDRCSRRCSTSARHQDGLRLRMLREPRGYPAANCNLVLPPTHPDADAGFVIMEQVEYPPMSGTNTICVTTALLETGMIPMREPVTELDARSAGRPDPGPRRLPRRQGHAGHVQERPGVRRPPRASQSRSRRSARVTVDVAWGGMFYVIADAAPFGLRLTPDEGRDITRIGELIKAATQEQLPVVHPGQPGDRGRHDRAALGPGRLARATTVATPSSSRRGNWTGTARRRGPARSIARRAAPGRARRWRRSTRAGC